MNRYSDSPGVRDILFRLDLDPFGAGVILIGPREHEAVAAALEEKIPSFKRVSAAEAGVMPLVTHPVLVPGLGPPGTDRDEALSRLNSRREWFSVRRQCVVILVDPGEMMDFQRRAGDLWAAPNFRTEIPYIPDPGVDEPAARTQLAEYLVHKLGRLDLRGFVRAESEDVSFRVEDVFVEVSAAVRPVIPPESGTVTAAAVVSAAGAEPMTPHETTGAGESWDAASVTELAMTGAVEPNPILWWVERAIHDPRRPLVVLGSPGAGKTFLLRWLTLRAVRDASLFGMHEPFPVFVSFATFARAPLRPTLLEHVVFSLLSEGEPAGHMIHRLMEEGRVLFLFDGLDETTSLFDRDRIRKGLQELRARAPRCPIILTSRVAGYEREPTLDPVEVTLSDLDAAAIRTFLSKWCELYAVDRKGASDRSREEGRKEGDRLAADVLASPSVRQIAGNPLLLTVLAIVHRAGVRLPEHRVELYDHATRVLVERWNRVRSEETADNPAPPLKSADAVRLLGPLALRMLRSGVRATVSLEVLREELGNVLERGSLRGLATVDEAVRLFRETLGILVEQAPGVFAFLHLTLGEFFAALELVRTGELEKVAADPRQAFEPHLREVLLLGAGILGVLRAEDARLAIFVENVLASAEKVTDPRSELPFLVLGLLADDPSLTEAQKVALVECLIPKLWFDRWPSWEDISGAASTALSALVHHLAHGRSVPWLARLKAQAALAWGEAPRMSGLRSNRFRSPTLLLFAFFFVDIVGTVLGARLEFAIMSCLRSLSERDLDALATADVSELTCGSLVGFSPVTARGDGTFSASVYRVFDEAARTGVLPLALRVVRSRKPPRHVADVPLASTVVEEEGARKRTVVFPLPIDTPPGEELSAAIVLQRSIAATGEAAMAFT